MKELTLKQINYISKLLDQPIQLSGGTSEVLSAAMELKQMQDSIREVLKEKAENLE